MAGYVLLAVLVVLAVWFVVHLRRTPPMPARRTFEEDPGASLICEPRKAHGPIAYSTWLGGDGGPSA